MDKCKVDAERPGEARAPGPYVPSPGRHSKGEEEAERVLHKVRRVVHSHKFHVSASPVQSRLPGCNSGCRDGFSVLALLLMHGEVNEDSS